MNAESCVPIKVTSEYLRAQSAASPLQTGSARGRKEKRDESNGAACTGTEINDCNRRKQARKSMMQTTRERLMF